MILESSERFILLSRDQSVSNWHMQENNIYIWLDAFYFELRIDILLIVEFSSFQIKNKIITMTDRQ
jgi:hypothetical protein